MEIRKVGVVGAGVMGVGLGQNLAQTGHEVVLVDVSDEVLARRAGGDPEEPPLPRDVPEGAAGAAPREPADAVLGRITYSRELEALGDVDFVVENVTEKWAIKKEIYPRIDAVCPERAVFAANTSCIPITRIGARDQAARPGARHALHEPGAAEADGRGDPRLSHHRGDASPPPASS